MIFLTRDENRPKRTRTFQHIGYHVRNPRTGIVHRTSLTLWDGEPADCAEFAATHMACGSEVVNGEVTAESITCTRCSHGGTIVDVRNPKPNAGIYDGNVHTWEC